MMAEQDRFIGRNKVNPVMMRFAGAFCVRIDPENLPCQKTPIGIVGDNV
jgi:hypothetical protein